MLKMGCGDTEEHAILFVCWLLAMQFAAVLVLGTSLLEGVKAAYVLVQFDEQHSWLINPSNGIFLFKLKKLNSGMRFLPNNPMCPLISVGTIITPTNIYGNIQKYDHPSLLDFDLRVSFFNPFIINVFRKRVIGNHFLLKILLRILFLYR